MSLRIATKIAFYCLLLGLFAQVGYQLSWRLASPGWWENVWLHTFITMSINVLLFGPLILFFGILSSKQKD